jgi:HAE1 family hydrophobic/amphiphilic exporter-1/multidrug efflux pump
MFSKFFINRPNFAIVVSLIIIIAGIMAIRTLPVQEYPDVVPPQIIVSTTYPGADAITLEKSVASVLEEKINGVENMLYMMSTTSPSGLLTMNLYLAVRMLIKMILSPILITLSDRTGITRKLLPLR